MNENDRAIIINSLIEMNKILQQTIKGAVDGDMKNWSQNLSMLQEIKETLEDII